MPNIIVCYKWVMDDQDIKVNPSTLELTTAGAKYKISEYDKNALEIGVQLKEAHGGSLQVLSFGGTNLKNSLKDILSRGADAAFWLADAAADNADAAGAIETISINAQSNIANSFFIFILLPKVQRALILYRCTY